MRMGVDDGPRLLLLLLMLLLLLLFLLFCACVCVFLFASHFTSFFFGRMGEMTQFSSGPNPPPARGTQHTHTQNSVKLGKAEKKTKHKAAPGD